MEICYMRAEGVGGDVSEQYMIKNKLVDADTYARHARGYADMPAPTSGADLLAQARTSVSQRHKSWLKEFRSHTASRDNAVRIDEECAAALGSASLVVSRLEDLSTEVLLGSRSVTESRKV